MQNQQLHVVEITILFTFRAGSGGCLERSPSGGASGVTFSKTAAVFVWPHGRPGSASAGHTRSHGNEFHVWWSSPAALPQVLLLFAQSTLCVSPAYLSCAVSLPHHRSEGAAGNRGTNAGGAADTPGEIQQQVKHLMAALMA